MTAATIIATLICIILMLCMVYVWSRQERTQLTDTLLAENARLTLWAEIEARRANALLDARDEAVARNSRLQRIVDCHLVNAAQMVREMDVLEHDNDRLTAECRYRRETAAGLMLLRGWVVTADKMSVRGGV